MKFQLQRGLGGNSRSLPYLVFLLSTSASICAWVWSGVVVGGHDQERFNSATEEAAQAISGRLDDQVDLLRAAGATFNLQGEWSHLQFHNFVSHLDLRSHYKGMEGFGFIRVIPKSGSFALEQKIRADGLPEFKVHPILAAPSLYPVTYLEPQIASNAFELGLDAQSSDSQMEAIEIARDTGSAVLSAVEQIPRKQGRSSTMGTFRMYFPVFRGGEVPSTIEDRRSLLVGLTFCDLNGGALFQNVLEGEARKYLEVQIFDMRSGELSRVYASGRTRRMRRSALNVQSSLPVYGREWILRFNTSIAFEQESERWLVQWILVSGLAVSCLLSAVSYSQVTANRRLTERTAELAMQQDEVRRLNENLEQLVHDRTTELRASNAELEAFCYSVSHDLRAPLRSVDGFSKSLLEDYGDRLDDEGIDYLNRVRNASKRMDELITALLNLSRITRQEIVRAPIDISQLAREVLEDALQSRLGKTFDVEVEDGLEADADPKLVRVVLDNLIGNAVKFGFASDHPRVVVGRIDGAFFVQDNGAGFNPAYADKLFVPFERLHAQSEFPGSGIGLATVQRIIQRHGGSIWAQSEPGKGATFFFTLK